MMSIADAARLQRCNHVRRAILMLIEIEENETPEQKSKNGALIADGKYG